MFHFITMIPLFLHLRVLGVMIIKFWFLQPQTLRILSIRWGDLTPSDLVDRWFLDAERSSLIILVWGLGLCKCKVHMQAIRRRFDKRIYIPLPDVKARQHMFKVTIYSFWEEKQISMGIFGTWNIRGKAMRIRLYLPCVVWIVENLRQSV